MRVLHVYSGNLFGGIETMLIACAYAQSVFPDLEHEFALCFDDRLAAELRHATGQVHVLGPTQIRRPASVFAARQALDDVLASRGFDRVICHAPWSQAVLGAVARRRGLPLVFWAHDVMTGRHWTERYAKFVPPDLVVCNSTFTASTLKHLYRYAPVVVVHPPVLAARAASGPGPPSCAERDDVRRDIRRSLDTSPSAFVIIQASRCEPWKGHAMLLEALTELADDHEWVWWLVGGAQRPEEEAFMASLRASAIRAGLVERIRWVGHRSDVPQLLRAADVHCQANLEPEPFGIAFVEALAAGLPVVTVALGGALEIVEDTCGLLTPPNDPHALAVALKRLMRDERLRFQLARQAPARAQGLCDPATQARALHAALQSMTPLQASA